MRSCALVLALATLGVGCDGASVDPAQRPNVILILTDDQPWSTVEYMPYVQQHLIQGGVRFDGYLVSDPICCPSRVTTVLGQYRHNHQIEAEQDGCAFRFFAEGNQERAIGAYLSRGGYRTGIVGKYLNRYDRYLDGVERGDHEHGLGLGWDDYRVLRDAQRYYDFVLHENGVPRSYPPTPAQAPYQTDVLADLAIDFLRESAADGKPFFLYLAPAPPHMPMTPALRHRGRFAQVRAPRPPSFNEADLSDKPSLRGTPDLSPQQIESLDREFRSTITSLLAVDEMVDAVVRELAALGLLETTFLFFASDNGIHHGEHRIPRRKATPFEESVRVPLIVRGPGVPPGSSHRRLASNVDLLPTILDLIGAERPDGIDGRSLRPLLGARPEASPWRTSLLLESLHENRTLTIPPFSAIRTERFKLVEYTDGESELYDLVGDPYELEANGETAGAEVRAELSKRLADLVHCAGSSCVEVEDRPFRSPALSETTPTPTRP